MVEWVTGRAPVCSFKDNGYSDRCSPHVPTRWPDYSGHCLWLVSALNACLLHVDYVSSFYACKEVDEVRNISAPSEK